MDNGRKIALIYFIVASLWILLSDRAVEVFLPADYQASAQTLKGWLFVFLMTFLLLIMLKKHSYDIRISEGRFSLLFDNAPLGIALLDRDGNLMMSNKALSNILGYTNKELQSLSFTKFTHPEDSEIDIAQYRKLMNREIKLYSMEKRYIRKDGRTIWGTLTVSAMFDKDGSVKYGIGMVDDITEHKKTQEELRKKDELMLFQSRQAAMGEMISMIAHQWRQPLGVIGMASNNLKLSLELGSLKPEAIKERLLQIDSQVEYLSQTIDDFRNFFRPEKEQESFDIVELLKSSINMIKDSFTSHNISLNFQSTKAQALQVGYPRELMQVVTILLNNAKDELLDQKEPSPYVSILLEQSDKSYKITITDNGKGIPDSIKERIYEPYFSTKNTQGTGLGLYMAKTIVEKHMEGTLSHRAEDRGASFIITLPKRSTI